eukprot:363137-Chlamydomonas_euryale.AAC.1
MRGNDLGTAEPDESELQGVDAAWALVCGSKQAMTDTVPSQHLSKQACMTQTGRVTCLLPCELWHGSKCDSAYKLGSWLGAGISRHTHRHAYRPHPK